MRLLTMYPDSRPLPRKLNPGIKFLIMLIDKKDKIGSDAVQKELEKEFGKKAIETLT